MIRPFRLLPLALLVAALAPAVRADDATRRPPAPPAPGGPPTIVHVPADELDVLLKAQGRGMLVRYAEYAALLEAARQKGETAKGQPPVDGALLAATGTLDLTGEKAAILEVVYRVRGLAPGPRAVPFASAGLALESVAVASEGGAGAAHYEEKDGQGRLFLDGPGARRVTVRASARAQQGAQRVLDVTLPDAAAFALEVRLPPGVEATLTGEGPARLVHSPAEQSLSVTMRPARGGRVVVAWAQAAKGTEGPSVLDADVKTLHSVGDGLIQTLALIKTQVLRTPAASLVLELPADLAVHAVEGPGVTGSRRSDDRRRLTVALESPRLGAVDVLLRAERRYEASAPGAGLVLPRITVVDALRHQGEVALRLAPDVNVRAVRVQGGRRVALAGQPQETAGVLRYRLAGPEGGLTLDLEPGTLRVDANGTYYLNLAEPGQTLLATVTYRVLEGTLFRLSPRFPPEFDLRELTLNGSTDGFTRDVTDDGRVEIGLAQGVPTGGEVQLLATLERARADWVPEKDRVAVPFAVPAAGATREEAYVAVGADAGFEVLDGEIKDLVAVGAADLTARGLSSTGLVYGYRTDGAAPAVALTVTRREPLIEADVVTALHPGPRRLDVAARAVYRIQRAGVRRLFLDLPAWAGEQVDFDAPYLRATTRLSGERRPADVPAGYERWQIDLEQRAIGTHVVTALFFLDRGEDDWRLEDDRVLAARVPVERMERLLVVRRADGLEVNVAGLDAARDLRTLDVAELPPEAAVDPTSVLEVVRLAGERATLALSVRKHGGAAVLDAIATEVSVRTAVAAEGILRTRAQVELFNVDRQFLEVRLPPRSTLIGAVVDGVPSKPLVDPQGALLVTVPTARAREARTRVVLTYDTALGRPVASRVTIEQPVFPGLEVLHTTQEVGFETDVEVASVSGDLLTGRPVERPTRTPWILGAVTALLAPGERAAVGLDASAVTSSPTRQPGGSGARGRLRGPGGGIRSDNPLAELGTAEPGTPTPPAAPAPGPTTPAPKPAPASGGEDYRESLEEQDVEASEAVAEGRARTPAGDPALGALADDSRTGLPRRGAPDRPAGGPGAGEGGALPGEPGFTRSASGRARKGALSLDVPVLLAPRRVVAQRVGGGGTLEIALISTAGAQRTHQALVLLTVALGLLVLWRRWLPAWLTVGAGFAVAGILALGLGASASVLTAAVADGATILAAALLLRGLARLVFGQRGAAATAALLLALCAAGAPAAHADEAEDAAERSASSPTAGTVIVPHDPAKGAGLTSDDRVFVPLATWLELQRQAYPERDPELVALGQVVALREAAYTLTVAGKSAEGRGRLVLAQRGRGMLLVPLAFPGVAITSATLNGQPVRLLLDGALYRVPLEKEGEHVLEITFRLPVESGPWGRRADLGAPVFAGSTLEIVSPDFEGDLYVEGGGRVEVTSPGGGGAEFRAKAWLGRVGVAPVVLVEKAPASLPAEVRTRAESRTIHSVRDGGTETLAQVTLHVLQGRAPFVDLDLPAGVEVLEATGSGVQRWETSPGRLRLVFAVPVEGSMAFAVRVFRAAGAPERAEALPELAVRDTTSESGVTIVNGDAALRLEADAVASLFRIARPAEPDAAGRDGLGRVLGAWRFAARPAPMSVKSTRAQPRVEATTLARVTFGDDRMRSLIASRLLVQRAPIGEAVFLLPGNGEVREVLAHDLQTWWVEGQGEARTLHVRFGELFEGAREVSVRLERRLGGLRDGLVAPRLELLGADADRGELVLFTLDDVEPAHGGIPGLKALPPGRLSAYQPNVEGARATHAFAWEDAVKAGLPVVLRTPEQELEAIVVTQIAPSDEEQRLEHLVLFDVRRGAVERLSFFVPDGGFAVNDVVRARDLREVRSERATRRDVDDQEVNGLLYTVRLQSPKSGLIEVTVSQLWPAATTVRVVRPEGGVKATRWFSLVGTFLDGEVDLLPGRGTPDTAAWGDLPFLPTGLTASTVVKIYAARAPYTVGVLAKRFKLDEQAGAVVLSAQADVVLGLDGEARAKVRYRLFNRSRQFLRMRLPAGAVLYGAVAAGLPVKPLAGPDGLVLIPIPKVPLGGAGYEVGLTYRARAGAVLHAGGDAAVVLPLVDGVEVDRTAIALWVPESLRYEFDTRLTPAQKRDVYGAQAAVALREATEVLKVAQQGTLDQRLFACSNGAPLLEEARQQLEQYKNLGGKQEVVAGLASELDKLTVQAQQASTKCQVDLGAANSAQVIESYNARASNDSAQMLLALSHEAAAQSGTVNMIQPQVNPGANWVFNAESVPLDKAGKDELVQLKGRLQKELERRDLDERRKSIDVQLESKSRAAQPKKQDGAKSKQVDELTATYDSNRNNMLLNDALRRVHIAQRQLGAADLYGFTGPQAEGQSLVPSNFTPPTPPELAPPFAGAFFSDVRGSDYRGRTENVFVNGQQRWPTLHLFTPQAGGGGGAAGGACGAGGRACGDNGMIQSADSSIHVPPSTRIGLMGVDVPLPEAGRVYWFLGAKAPEKGLALKLTAAPERSSGLARVALAGALLAVLVFALARWGRSGR